MTLSKSASDLKKFKLKLEVQKKFANQQAEYKSIVESIKIDIGGLEEVRKTLGLSRRQMCKLLLVDPSAWTRWTRQDQDAPPHIYQALKWYMQLVEKTPDIHAPLHLENKFDLMRKDTDLKTQKLQLQIQKLETQKSQVNDPYFKFSHLLSENFKVISDRIIEAGANQSLVGFNDLKSTFEELQAKVKTLEAKSKRTKKKTISKKRKPAIKKGKRKLKKISKKSRKKSKLNKKIQKKAKRVVKKKHIKKFKAKKKK